MESIIHKRIVQFFQWSTILEFKVQSWGMYFFKEFTINWSLQFINGQKLHFSSGVQSWSLKIKVGVCIFEYILDWSPKFKKSRSYIFQRSTILEFKVQSWGMYFFKKYTIDWSLQFINGQKLHFSSPQLKNKTIFKMGMHF